ncbi:4Fe-4S binding protein [Denitrobacterium detoxificans]|uniref:4Fe-4S binding protein n=1 Tax=Denitrobacterium detoxificans TaxID=79604 RepID=UPI0026ECBD0C|nr:4Fe-4S binding protein [Denitrobacterium detoxificans]MBE6465916.1 4Fe-4S dicluster domain-containing protein [Denitrobacterium detoxificans]
MPKIASMVNLIEELESSYITVHRERCVQVRNCNADCLRCASVCTTGCIHFDGEELTVSPERCIGCGTCATICPTCALEAHHPNDAEFMNQCLAVAGACEGIVTVACGTLLDRVGDLVDRDAVVRVECLGRVEESALTELVVQGAKSIVLVRGACESCAHATGYEMVQRVCDTERQLLEAWGASADIRLADKLPKCTRAKDDGYDKGKRAFFESSKREGARMGAIAVDHAVRDALGENDAPKPEEPRYTKVMDDGTLPHFLPDRRESLLNSLATLGEPEDVMIDTRLWGHVIIDTDTCSSCQMCSTFCPTGALARFVEEDGTFGVEHYPGDCVKCRTCSAICPTGALSISEEVFARDMLAGMTDRYTMTPRAVKEGTAHTIWHKAELFTNTDQVYER